MNSCELVTLISAIACHLSNTCIKEELSILAPALTQLGDTLQTILAHNELCEDKKN